MGSTDTNRKRAQKDQLARTRAVHGWAFRLRAASDKPSQFIMNHWAIHQAPDKCQPCRQAQLWTDDQAEKEAIRSFLNGGPCPEDYKRLYELARKQLGLPGGTGHHGH